MQGKRKVDELNKRDSKCTQLQLTLVLARDDHGGAVFAHNPATRPAVVPADTGDSSNNTGAHASAWQGGGYAGQVEGQKGKAVMCCIRDLGWPRPYGMIIKQKASARRVRATMPAHNKDAPRFADANHLTLCNSTQASIQPRDLIYPM